MAPTKVKRNINSNSISYGCSFIGGRKSYNYSTAQFRIPWGLQMIPAVFLNIGMLFLPESPRWLARKDRWEDCHHVLTTVHGKGDPNHSFVVLELQDIREMCEFERQYKHITYFDLFRPRVVNRTHIALATQIWSQLTGMNVMSKLFSVQCQPTSCLPRPSVLYYLRLQYGWIQGQQYPPRLLHLIYHQRCHDRAGSYLARQMGPSADDDGRRFFHDGIHVR